MKSAEELLASLHRQCALYKQYSYHLRGYEDMYQPPAVPKDLTAEVNKRLFPPIPAAEEENVIWVHATLQGYPGTGKSKLLEYLYYVALGIYGEEQINLIWTNSPAIAFKRIDSRPVQLMMIDDAARCANSLQMLNKDNMDAATMFQQLRHRYEEVSGKKYGVIICILSWQRRTELRKTYRQGFVQFFKSAGAEKDERDWLIANFGRRWYNRLRRLTDRMQCGDNRCKSLSIAYLPSLGKELGGVGFYHSQLVRVAQWPSEMLSEAPTAESQNAEAPAEKQPTPEEIKLHATWYVETPEMKRYAQYYQLYYVEKAPLAAIANQFGVTIKAVSYGIRHYREVLLYELN